MTALGAVSRAKCQEKGNEVSKNAVTLEQIEVACRHVLELMEAGMTENFAIRNLELFANMYAKFRLIGNTSPDRADQFDLWSKAALDARNENRGHAFGQYLRVEHGTPRRQFARLILEAWETGELDQAWLDELCDTRWKVAVITHEEDKRLNTVARSRLFNSPEERWAAAGIEF